MKTILKYTGLAAGVVLAGSALQSCALDEPFGNKDGEGVLQMKLVVNSDVTRAEYDEAQLASNCIVYISGEKGLLHKYQGIENVPDRINLKNGHYVAEAWTGDSVPASFDSKFFRGYQPFDINGGLENVVLKCRIANVVVSINANTVNDLMMSGWNVNVGHSRGALDFTSENMDYAKGYFMMPSTDRDLTVTVTGKNAEGTSFTKTQTIADVERAHEYVLNFSYNPEATDPTDGGAFLTITVDDTEVLVEDEVEIFGRPSVAGVEFDVNRQIIGNQGAFKDMFIKVNCFGGLEHFYLRSDDHAAMNLPSNDIDLCNATETVKQQITAAGLVWESSFKEDKNLLSGYLTLSAKWLNALPERDTEYALNATLIDKYGKSADVAIRIAVGEGAVVIEDPVTVDDVPTDNLMAVLTTKATLTGSLVSADAVNPGIRYRESGSSEWQFAPADGSAQRNMRRRNLTPAQAVRSGGAQFSVTLTGLKPGTRYEYQACAEDFNSPSKFFTTEGRFEIPNASFEEWSNFTENSKVRIPGPGGERTFWDSGNHGSATMSVTLTDFTNAFKHSGSGAARMETKFVGLGGLVGKLASGNLFAGKYAETKGTNGVIEFGRPYDGSHPSALKVYVNYRQGSEFKGSGHGELTKTSGEFGQIYVALTTGIVTVDTSNTNTLFNPEGDYIVGYGQVTWNENVGADGQLAEVTIPIDWKSKARTVKPTHLIITCAASKYGDYFTGYAGTVMVVDDFELVYE